jgi:hypothetical protein
MVRMAERHGLIPRHRGARHVGGTVDLDRHPGGERQNGNRAEDRNPRKCVGASMKDLGHCATPVPTQLERYRVASVEQAALLQLLPREFTGTPSVPRIELI